MGIITRKCHACKQSIDVRIDNIHGILFFKNAYYHTNCFIGLCKKRLASKRGKPQMWQDALDRLWELESETNKMLENYLIKDELNQWLLDHYDIFEVPSRFWQIVADLEIGKYKGKRCKPVEVTVLCGCWKWGQKKLDEIDQYNKSHNKGPTDDNARLMYDLAILIGKIPNYLNYKARQKVMQNEMKRSGIFNDDIDMSKIGHGKQIKRKDISDISDDIFTE